MTTVELRQNVFALWLAAGSTEADAHQRADEAAALHALELKRQESPSQAIIRRASGMTDVIGEDLAARVQAYLRVAYDGKLDRPFDADVIGCLALGAALGTAWVCLTPEQQAAVDAGSPWGIVLEAEVSEVGSPAPRSRPCVPCEPEVAEWVHRVSPSTARSLSTLTGVASSSGSGGGGRGGPNSIPVLRASAIVEPQAGATVIAGCVNPIPAAPALERARGAGRRLPHLPVPAGGRCLGPCGRAAFDSPAGRVAERGPGCERGVGALQPDP